MGDACVRGWTGGVQGGGRAGAAERGGAGNPKNALPPVSAPTSVSSTGTTNLRPDMEGRARGGEKGAVGARDEGGLGAR